MNTLENETLIPYQNIKQLIDCLIKTLLEFKSFLNKAMSNLKTQANDNSVEDFLNSIEYPTRKADGLLLLNIFKEKTGEKPVMWGPSIVGFGNYRYKYSSGKEMDWFSVGFSPRKHALSIHIMLSKTEIKPFLAKLGKHKQSAGCIYINKMSDVNEEIFREMIHTSINLIQTKNE